MTVTLARTGLLSSFLAEITACPKALSWSHSCTVLPLGLCMGYYYEGAASTETCLVGQYQGPLEEGALKQTA